MDTLTHTLIALACMFATWYFGRWTGLRQGYQEGLEDVWTRLLQAFDAKSIVITEQDDVILTDYDGNIRILNDEEED